MTTQTEIKSHEQHRKGRFHKLAGIAVSVVGVFWLAKKAGWIPVVAGGSQVFWPILTIALGLMLVFGTRKAHGSKANKH